MTNKELEFIDLTNKQYEALINMQMKAYREVLDLCKEDMGDLEKRYLIDKNISEISEKVLTELEEIRVYNKLFIEAIK
ncbi:MULTISPECIES: hypothetical protein [unclassified Clostridium]|uniref:hypothetical protein n=1 Tax=unclassified Clostridium TaxID=2614128 RepID=UPI00029732EA|nr:MULTISPECIES: hypothetical protein [unclassified Clostridium]EKQ51592.1 MAG: hypothetical protein A370_04770 [Clostridium sp. Maddingley MBC34-26]